MLSDWRVGYRLMLTTVTNIYTMVSNVQDGLVHNCFFQKLSRLREASVMSFCMHSRKKIINIMVTQMSLTNYRAVYQLFAKIDLNIFCQNLNLRPAIVYYRHIHCQLSCIPQFLMYESVTVLYKTDTVTLFILHAPFYERFFHKTKKNYGKPCAFKKMKIGGHTVPCLQLNSFCRF